MTTNTELIADLQSNIVGDPFPLMWKAADAIEALESEVGRLKGLAVMEFNEDEVPSFTQGYHPHELTTAVTADRCSVLVKMITDLRAQLAAAQGKSQQYDEALCTVAEQRDTMKLRIRQHLANRYAYTSKEFCEKLEEILFAAPIPQQPSVPEGWKQAVALAYGHLWHVNNEPMAPTPLRSSETAAYEARKQLRDLLTHEERGLAINQVQAILEAAPQPKDMK